MNSLWRRRIFVYGMPVTAILMCLFHMVAAGVAAMVSRLFPPCIFHEMTGALCPGCGFTRSMLTLLNGNVLASLRYNILPVCAILLLILFYIECAVREWAGESGAKFRLFPRNQTALVVALTCFGAYVIFRNFIPLF